MPEVTLFQRMFPGAIGSSFRQFLFGRDCACCKRGWGTRRWARYDGTGSWRMHQRGSVTFDTYESDYCERNGWFSRHWFTTTFLCLVVVGLTFASIVSAFAQEHRHPPQDQAIHDRFYSTWTMPDIPHVSCCHDQDCAPVASKFEGGAWFAMKDGQWIKIPDHKIERNRDTPDGRSHLCGRWFGSDFSVFCFISGAGG